MSDKEKIKSWIDANVWDGEDRSGAENDCASFTPDSLQELAEDLCGSLFGELEAENKRLKEDIGNLKNDNSWFNGEVTRLKRDNEKIAEFIGYPKCFKDRSFLDAVLEACEYS